MPTVSDATATPERLLLRFRETRDPDALGALFDLTAPGLLRVALSTAPDAASAENALQETFLAVLEAPERWDETRPVTPWLLGILHRQVGKVRRDGARSPDPLRLAPPLAGDDPADVAASREEMERARAAIDELPEPYRAVALMRWRHGLDPADIANIRGEAPGTTRSLLSRALEKLRHRLGGAALVLFGGPMTRGLDGIRRAVMSKTTTTATTASAAVVVGGALVMKKIVAACVVVALLAGGTWWAAARHARSSAATTSHADVVAAVAERKRRHAAEAATASKSEIPPVDLDKCDRDLDLFGRVIDENGKPIGGATVETLHYAWRNMNVWSSERYDESEEGPATRTARDGTFAVRLDRGARVDLRVAAETFGDVIRENCQAGERVTMTLRHGATLDVTAVDESGAPVKGVALKLILGGQYNQSGPMIQQREGATDAAGHVAFNGLIAGQSVLYVAHATLGTQYPGFQRVRIPSSCTLPLRLTMLAGRTITGRVVDADTNEPIVGARVRTDQRDPPPATTGADGRYAFPRWIADDTRKLRAEAAGYGAVPHVVPADGYLNFALHRGDRVIGRLVREDGSPVEDGYVWAHGSEVNQRVHAFDLKSDSVTARTSADGRFELAGMQREFPHTLIASAPGLARTLRDFEKDFWGRTTIDLGDIEMSVARSIEGVAVDVDGRPLPDVDVDLAEVESDGSRRGGYERTRRRRTDDLGRFRFPDLAEGTYAASVGMKGAPQGPVARVELTADTDVTGVRVTLRGSRKISVLVLDPDGAPVVDAYVGTDAGQTIDGVTTSVGASTDADGRVALRGLPDAAVSLHVYRPRSGRPVSAAGPTMPEGQEIRVVLPRTAAIRGFARTEDGRVIPRQCVKATLHRDGTGAGAVWVDTAGAFAVEVPEGEVVDLVIDEWQSVDLDPGYENRRTGFEGRLNGVKSPADGVVITLRPVNTVYDRTLTVVVQDSTGVPVPGVELGVYEGPPPKSWKMKTDADGRARLDGLPNHLLVVNFAEMTETEPQHARDIAPRRVSVIPNGQEVVARFRAGAAIRGRVVDAKGRAVPEPYIQVMTRDPVYIQTRGDADGRFVTYGLPGLPHQLTAAGYVDGVMTQGVAEGVVPGDTEVSITVAPKAK